MMSADRRCDGMVALVTGSSRGLGKAIAARLAARGATVALTARTMDPDPKYQGSLSQTLDEIVAAGGKAVRPSGSVPIRGTQTAFRRGGRRRRRPGHPGQQRGGDLPAAPRRVSRTAGPVMMEMHVLGPLQLCQLAIPAMRERGRGWILNLTSVGGDLPPGPPFSEFDRTAGFGIYGTVKAALNRLTKSLAAELYDDGIAVNAAAPSNPVATPGPAPSTWPRPAPRTSN